MNKKTLYILILLIFSIGGIISIHFYQKIYGKSVLQTGKLYIKTTDSTNDVAKKLRPFIKNIDDFNWVTQLKKVTKIKGGLYQLKEGMSLNEVVNLLRSGNQTPIKISFNNQDTLEKLAGRVSQQIAADSIALLQVMKDTVFLNKYHFSEKSALGMYIPNKYEVYWTISPKKFRAKMLKEYQRFWNSSRTQKAKKIGLSKDEVITLASIVQKETAQKSERPIVAGLYLNRLKNGWPLQADPTLIFAVKEIKGHDFVIKRVLNADKKINSPYNTYKYKGLPPTLISMPDISAIDAVLNYKKHNYYFMCASTDKFGFHDFASSLAQHNRNAAKYQRWINRQGIRR